MKNRRFICTELRLIIGLCVLTAALVSCGEEEANPEIASLAPSMKGYELYSWQAGQTWVFKLMVGTDRLKTLDEVMRVVSEEHGLRSGVEAYTRGVEELRAALNRLPDGTHVVWRGSEALERMGIGPGNLALPPWEIIDEVTSYAAQAGITIEVLQ